MVNLDGDLAELKRAVVHLDLGLKAYKTAVHAETDAQRLLASCGEQLARISALAEAAKNKVNEETGSGAA